MRKVTESAVYSFQRKEKASCGNTMTDGCALFLHGNKIAWHGEYNGAAGVFFSLACWGTPTTRDRLNGVLSTMGHRNDPGDGRPLLAFFQEKGKQYIGETSRSRKEALEIDEALDVIFVAHPCTATGVRAVCIIREEEI